MNSKPDVLILGGGVIGCSIAYYLSKAGASVTVVERGDIGGATSGAAAGILAPLIESGGPGSFVDLGVASLRMFPSLADELRDVSGVDIEYMKNGVLDLALSETEERELRARHTWQVSQGFQTRWVTPAEARKIEPGLSPELRGGLYSTEEGQVSGLRLARAFAQGAARYGATFILGAKARGLIAANGRVTGAKFADRDLTAGHVILATGAWTGMWSEWLGPKLPVQPVRGQILSIHHIPVPVRHIIFGGGHGYLTPKPDGSVWVGATQEEVGYDSRVTAAGVAFLLNLIPYLAPGLAQGTFQRAWAQLRPGSPDNLPLIGPIPDWQGVTVASGHFRNGILLAPITGKLVAELLIEGEPSISLEPFSPARFAGRGT